MHTKLSQWLEAGLGLEEEDALVSSDDTEVQEIDEPEAALDRVESEQAVLELELTETGRDIEKLEAASVALESYAQLLEQSLASGGLKEPTARFLYAGLQTLGVEQAAFPSTEGYHSSSTRYLQTQVSLESVKETLQEFFKKLQAMFKKFFQLIRRMIDNVVSGITTNRVAAKALLTKANLKQRQQATTKEPQMRIENPGSLMIGEVWGGDRVDLVAGFADYAISTVPTMQIRHLKRVRDALKRVKPGENMSELVTALSADDGLLRSFPEGRDLRQLDEVKTSEVLPGNRVYTLSKNIHTPEIAYYIVLLNRAPGEVIDPTEGGKVLFMVPVLALNEIKRNAELLVRANDMLANYYKQFREIESLAEEIVKLGQSIWPKTAEITQAGSAEQRQIFRNIQNYIVTNGQHGTQTLAYIVQTYRRMIRYWDAMLDQYDAPFVT